ncbi:MAG: hypothetical protein Q8L86_10260 [Vicinamibacterales bacterium]|nr:hypothetical protein [Vicinamibacterales bacterium]
MAVGFSKPRDTRAIPEHVLWTLTKGGRTAEARTRMVPLGPELRVYVSHLETGALELLWSEVFRVQDGGGAALRDLAEQTQRDFEARGWKAVNQVQRGDLVVTPTLVGGTLAHHAAFQIVVWEEGRRLGPLFDDAARATERARTWGARLGVRAWHTTARDHEGQWVLHEVVNGE